MEDRNQITLIGTLSGEPEWRELPDGGEVVVWRTVVRRRSRRSDRLTHDTLRCVAYEPAVQRSVRAWTHGDLIELNGSLRRRFWDSQRSMYEVEVFTATLSSGTDPPDATSPAAE